MSTRANIIITDISGDKLFFYRHSDGYPEGTLPTLKKFMTMVAAGKIRSNVSQAAGHLIVIGAKEYAKERKNYPHTAIANDDRWKVGTYEPTTGIHGDINYLYRLDLSARTIEILTPAGKPTSFPTFGFKKKSENFIE